MTMKLHQLVVLVGIARMFDDNAGIRERLCSGHVGGSRSGSYAWEECAELERFTVGKRTRIAEPTSSMETRCFFTIIDGESNR